jgi:hypothetical protein
LAAYQPQAKHLFLDESRVPISAGLALRNLASAIFALERSRDHEGQNRVLVGLRRWLRHRPDLKQAFGTWYAEAVAPAGLLRVRRGDTISLDEVVPMMATRIMQDIKRRVAEGVARETARGHARWEAQGEARGRAIASLELLRDLVRSGDLTVDAARAKIRALHKAKAISRDQAKAALARLG